MGPRRSGKSSIQKVVFHKMSPNETLFLESSNKLMVCQMTRRWRPRETFTREQQMTWWKQVL